MWGACVRCGGWGECGEDIIVRVCGVRSGEGCER